MTRCPFTTASVADTTSSITTLMAWIPLSDSARRVAASC
jgi:hypothetical protein